MLDPLSYTLQLNQACAMGAFRAGNIMTAAMKRLLDGEQALLFNPFHRRAEEHKEPPVAPTGASWADRYGKRSHDVSVEKMR